MTRAALWVGISLVLPGLLGAEPAPAAKNAEITSDRLQIQKSGEETLFRGNVLLKQVEQWIEADEMTRYRLTGIAEARGHVRGTWFSPGGEKIIGRGDKARYAPLAQTTDLWGKHPYATLTRWETAIDTMPVVMHALHFTAKQQENIVLAHANVIILQTPRFEGRSDEARYNRTDGTLEMWGHNHKQVQIHLNDRKGSGDFLADKAWMVLSPRKARLTGRVTGHVIPSTES